MDYKREHTIETTTQALLIFIKNAVAGKVKTRLANTVGETRALSIYRALLQHTRNVALGVEADRQLFYSDQVESNDEWPAEDFEKFVQQGPDLGARMHEAFQSAFKAHDRVVIIGSDCATLTSQIVNDAFAALEQHDFVIGPALDGGYYLLGMRFFTPVLFENVTWSTDSVFTQTINKINTLGQSYTLLPELSDIDYEEDWNKYGWVL